MRYNRLIVAGVVQLVCVGVRDYIPTAKANNTDGKVYLRRRARLQQGRASSARHRRVRPVLPLLNPTCEVLIRDVLCGADKKLCKMVCHRLCGWERRSGVVERVRGEEGGLDGRVKGRAGKRGAGAEAGLTRSSRSSMRLGGVRGRLLELSLSSLATPHNVKETCTTMIRWQ